LLKTRAKVRLEVMTSISGPIHHPDGSCLGTIEGWMVDKALPLWANSGWDAKSEMFVERLALDGRPQLHIPRRAMVQARQIYVYSVAHRRQWSPGAKELVLLAAQKMISLFFERDGDPGWAFSVDAGGRIVDSRRDLYAHAFVLLALANAYDVAPDPLFLETAAKTLSFLNDCMATSNGGYQECWPVHIVPRRQNPHMHLFEALLALHSVAPQSSIFLDEIAKLGDLLVDRFLQAHGSILAEFFDEDWNPVGGELTFEPGHHFEWIWLLAWRQRSGARQESLSQAWKISERLWRVAQSGVDENGVIFAQVAANGRIVDRSTRLWIYTEAAKAAYFVAKRLNSGDDGPRRYLDLLYERFLLPAAPGAWIDQFDGDGRPMVDYTPASSLYHICCCVDVLLTEVSRSE
jgi:mannose/cellobiose epimerase-like protein (N-acyl-D-glucosamine 2-epimerase family)